VPVFASVLGGVGTFVAVVVFVAIVFGGSEFVAGAVDGEVLNTVAIGFVLGAFGELSSDLKSVEDAAGAAETEALGRGTLNDLGEDELDDRAVSDDGKVDRGVRLDVGGRVRCQSGLLLVKRAVQLHVEVAIGHAAERRSVALAAAGFDLAADHACHAGILLSVFEGASLPYPTLWSLA
jgi:hypothetical protein